ncbi:hypothetical protein QBC38DRAFT_353056 [Podospora fimiseda]|uniref:Mediator complex subunit 15 KIX domain-containing protein n=1 Tax=Podospora fimiseda TaxID=252190 RepID=A0AAN7BYV2_9PEZI|nr:hypothetical protein QBC38DRAFT_353056 [Podospora fimiseda]
MAANMPQQQMLMQQQQQQQRQQLPKNPNEVQLNQLVHQYIISTYAGVPSNGWQHQVPRNERFTKVMTLCSNIALAMPSAPMPRVFSFVTEFEKGIWVNSPDKAQYDQQFNVKMQDWLRKRQSVVPELQTQLTVDAARQAAQQQHIQQQHQLMIMARMNQQGQPGFPHMQNPMQMGAMPPQAQMAMGMMNAGMVQNRPDQRQFPMQMSQQSMAFPDVNQLTPPDRQRLNEVAMAMMMKATEQNKSQIRQMVVNNSKPELIQECHAKGHDPAIIWFRQRALDNLRTTRLQQQQQQQLQQLQQQRNLVGANFMQPPGQGQMNPNLMNSLQQGGPNASMNIGAIQAGQQLPGRNAAPGPMGGIPQQALGQNLNQMPRGPMQPPFGIPPQNVKIENQVAIQQLQQHAQQARAIANPSMQDRFPATSQSPGVNPLNAPLRQPAAPGGQVGGPAVNQGNPPIGTLNPTFNHNNNTRPQSVSGPMNNSGMTAGVGGAAPENSVDEVLKAWGQHQRPLMNPNKPAQVSGIPGQLSGGQGTQNPLGVVNAAQKPPLSGPQRAQIANFARTPGGKAQMDDMAVAPNVLNLVVNTLKGQGISFQGVDLRKWSQLWHFLQSHLPASRLPNLHATLSQAQFSQFIAIYEQKIRNQAGQMPTTLNGAPANPQPQFPSHPPPGAVLPQHGFHATPEEIETFRKQQPPGASQPDDQTISNYIVNFKKKQYIAKAWSAYNSANNHGNEVQGGAGQPNPTPFSRQPQLQTPAQKPPGAPGVDVPGNNISRPSLQQSLHNQQQQQQPTRPNPSPVPAQTPAPKNNNHLKRPSPDDTLDGVAQPGTAMQRSATQPSRPPAQMTKSSEADLLKPNSERQGETESIEAVLKSLGQEESAKFRSQQHIPLDMPPEEYREAQRKVMQLMHLVAKLKGKLLPWFIKTQDKEKARFYWKVVSINARNKIYQQEQPGAFKKVLTYSHHELDRDRHMLNELVKEVTECLNQDSKVQSSTFQPPPSAPASQKPPQPQPLSAENLEKFKAAPQRPMPKGGHPPPAPTTTQAPYHQFPMQHSPAGNPHYLSEPSVSQDNLVIPPRKKAKPNPTAPAKPNPGSSSPVVKVPSPVVARNPEPVIAAPKFTCPETGCQMNSVGFHTEEALKSHREEEHIKPFENPREYMREQMAAALGLDARGHSKPPPKPVGQEAGPPMQATISRQGQSPANRVDMATPMSRDPSMRRQGSAPGARAGDGTPQMVLAEEGWAHATVDPSALFNGLGHTLDSVTGGNIMAEFGAYRSVTPNDTPESTTSKDSATSEPNSDITEGAALDIDLNWQPVESDLLLEMNSFSMSMEGMDGLEGLGTSMFDSQFGLDEVQADFSKPFVFDNSFYSMDPSV